MKLKITIEIIEDKIKKTFDYKDEDNQSFLKNEVFLETI